ncbi:MiaB-like tRNA modifying enzyme YliG [Desulfofarcimen acetoxidans DSM 771]|uniref:Ribosomal protein uS12 methylthiotransferase RimO n=1 Tax=Desulfofarcimen acetoxidans (strain ATCC 49208 / DSM 771 / KCTC 5769 / VKM B-1644 / 5575) TaxID=485916 RepID=C8W4H6_DESAS|nr:30S ribosomal protein S12 methylthiotransferase RimO [Desulfofarcimen acetoxidans]ACV63862.1 MiaB-like tRNA modifying enzyme YliG [Desulfofarcimen acetoxidans DSM 771]
MTLKVGIVSLGCAKNLVDTEIMLGFLKRAGYSITNREKDAEVLVVNTCGFITEAKEEAINTILEMAQFKLGGKCRALLVAGCLAQRYAPELLKEMPEIDGILGIGSIGQIVSVIERVLAGERVREVGAPEYVFAETARILATPPYTAYLKIAEGCDNKCSYCAIPGIRGSFLSRKIDSIKKEAAALAAQGVREAVLIAQDTTKYGFDLYGKFSLSNLIKELTLINDIEWIRLLYCYPSKFTPELIDVLASEKKVCRYLDIPLQHASDSILLSMNRSGTAEQNRRLIEKLRQAVSGIALRTSFIVGFPGETEADFQTLLDYMQEIRFDRVGIFVYSPEEDTPAAALDNQIAEDIKQDRYERAMLLQQKISLENNRRKVGSVVSVLIEGIARNKEEGNFTYTGRSEFDAPGIDGKVLVETQEKLSAGEIVPVLIKKAYEYDLIGELTR